MADSSKTNIHGTEKKHISIPSIDEIANFETNRPKVPSNFRSKIFPDQQPSGNTSKSAPESSENGSRALCLHSSASSSYTSQSRASGQIRIADVSGQAVRSKAKQGGPSSTVVSSTGAGGGSDVQEASHPAASSGACPSSVVSSTSSTNDENAVGADRPGDRPRPRPKVQFSSAADFIKKRGKIGSSFADKFMMLGKVEEYKVPQMASKGPTSALPLPPHSSTAGQSKAGTGNSVIVNPRQRGNPILKHIRNVPWEFGDVVPDYVMGRTTCAFFLSLRYHHLNPNYIHDRLMELGHRFDLRVLLVQVDVKDPHHTVKELARLAILADCTLILAWSAEEAGRYLETYKAYENKSADALKEKVEQDSLSKMTDCLTTVKSINRTDVITLLANYGTFEKIVETSKEELAMLPGFGPQKAQRLSSIFTEPFLRKNKRRKLQPEAGGRADNDP